MVLNEEVLCHHFKNIYISNLFSEFKSTGLGCHVGNIFAGAFGNTDDTVYSLNNMYIVCKEYSEKYDILFNSHEIKLMVFCHRRLLN